MEEAWGLVCGGRESEEPAESAEVGERENGNNPHSYFSPCLLRLNISSIQTSTSLLVIPPLSIPIPGPSSPSRGSP